MEAANAPLEIPLSHGYVALIDADDYPLIEGYSWWADTIGGVTYAKAGTRRADGGRTTVSMHRLILNVEGGMLVDHKDGDGLNNCRANLRPCTSSENNMNKRLNSASVSGYKGVHWYSPRSKWRVRIYAQGRNIYLGLFDCKHDAASMYNIAAIEHFGEFAKLNIIIREEAA